MDFLRTFWKDALAFSNEPLFNIGKTDITLLRLTGLIVIAVLVWVSNFFGSLFEPASSAMVADMVEPSRRLEAYGLLRIGQNIGWTVGPLLGGLLAGRRDAYTYLPQSTEGFVTAERLAAFKVPRYVEFLAELPKTPSSKVQKHLLREAGGGIVFDRTAPGKK